MVVSKTVRDALQSRDTLARVNPLRAELMRAVRRTSHEAGPFSPEVMESIKRRAETGQDESSFGTQLSKQAYSEGRIVNSALIPGDPPAIDRVRISADSERFALDVPPINLGALGYGPVNEQVIETFGIAAGQFGCLRNTGEDGLTPFHLSGGPNLIWQIGSGYWSCRSVDGSFDETRFAGLAADPRVAAVELKLTQGAKPGIGGHLPASKNTPDVAEMMSVEPYTDVEYPSRHSEFNDISGCLDFVAVLRRASGGKPIGLKTAIGGRDRAAELAQEIKRTGIAPDYLVVDGGQGGTGAAPTVLQDHAALAGLEATSAMNDALLRVGLRRRIALFGTGAVANGFDLLEFMDAGADGCFMVRAPMIAIGCDQYRLCHLGNCPNGIATHSKWRKRGVVPSVQSRGLANFLSSVERDAQVLLQAAAIPSSAMVTRGEASPFLDANSTRLVPERGIDETL